MKMHSRQKIKQFLKKVAHDEGFDDAQTIKNIDNWQMETINRILDFTIQKYTKEVENFTPGTTEATKLLEKIGRLEAIKADLSTCL
ncbi:MAG: hypothetical protein WCN95_04190 [bacterium]